MLRSIEIGSGSFGAEQAHIGFGLGLSSAAYFPHNFQTKTDQLQEASEERY